MTNCNPNSTNIATPAVETPEKQVFTYFHRHRVIVLIPAVSEEEADRVFQRQYGSLGSAQSNLFEV